MNKILLTLLFIFTIISTQSQNIDSLIYVNTTTDIYIDKYHTLNEIIDYYLLHDITKAKTYIDKGINFALKQENNVEYFNFKKREGWFFRNQREYQKAIDSYDVVLLKSTTTPKQKAYIYKKIGYCNRKIDNYTLSIKQINRAKNIYLKLNNTYEIAQCELEIAAIYKSIGSYDTALENSLKSLKTFTQLKNGQKCAEIYNTIGSIYKYQKHYNRALQFYLKALDYHKQTKDTIAISASYNYLGIVYNILKKHDTSLDYYERALDIRLKRDSSKAFISTIYNNIALIYSKKGNSEKAFYYIRKSFSVSNSPITPRIYCNRYNSLGIINYHAHKYDSAAHYFKKSLKYSLNINRIQNLNNNYFHLYKIYEEKKNYKNAFNYYKLYKQTNDSIFNSKQSRQISNLELDWEIKKEFKDNEIQLQKIRYTNTIVKSTLFIAFIIFLSLFIYIYMRNKKNNLLRQKIKLEKIILEDNMEHQKRDLTANVISLTEKNNFIDIVTEKLIGAINLPISKQKKAVSEVIKSIQYNKENSYLDEFENRFEQIHSAFFKNIITEYPNLTANERKLISFLKLDLSTKEISHITKQTTHSINVARTRLRKKLNLANQDISFTEFLNKFD